MKSSATWVERGPDGRPYFVRKKTKLPSAIDLISSALLPQRRNSSLPFTRAFKKDHLILPAPVGNPLALPPPPPQPTPNIPPPNSGSGPVRSQFQTPESQPPLPSQAQLIAMYPYQTPTPAMQDHTNNNSNSDRQDRRGYPLKPQTQFFPAPHPSMYPIAPYPPQIGYQSLPAHLTHQVVPNQPLHPHGVCPAQPLHAGARIVSPPRFPTAADMKYKCRVCGRFRSSRYHYRHPIAPGELPGETVCRRCREDATDSEDDSSDSRFGRTIRRTRSISRGRDTAVVITGPRGRSRGGSLSQVELVPCSRSQTSNFHGRRYTRAYSRSSSLDVEPLRISIDDDRRYRGHSPSVSVIERVHYVEDPPFRRPSYTEETIYYEEDSRGRRRRIYEDEFYDDDRDYAYALRTRRSSRPPTPQPRLIRRQYSDPIIREPRAIEHRVYYDGTPSNIETRTQLARRSRPASRASSRGARVESRPARQLCLGPHISGSDDSSKARGCQLEGREQRGWCEVEDRGRRIRDRSRRHSHHRSFTAESSREAPRPPCWLAHAPSPSPQLNSSSLASIEPRAGDEEEEGTRTTQHSAIDRHGRPTTVTRRSRSRSRSVGDHHRAATILRPSDDITVIERERPAPVEDYDWYDQNGMRVRVREI